MELRNLWGAEFFTTTTENAFEIMIKEESDCSVDGGYSHEVITNSFGLTVDELKMLVDELITFQTKNKSC